MPDFAAHSHVQKASERSFGYVFTTVFLIISTFPLLYGNPLRTWALLIAAIFLGFTLLYPKALAPLNRLWFKFGELLGRIISPIVMLLVFFVAVVPTALIVRIFGKDLLRLKLDKSAKSYWINRDHENSPMGSMKNQF